MSDNSKTIECEQWRTLLALSPESTTADVCRALERLAVDLAPHDLGPMPFYVAAVSCLPPKFATASRFCGGWYCAALGEWLRPHLAHYTTAGPAIIVNDVMDFERRQELARAAATMLTVAGDPATTDEMIEFAPETVGLDAVCGIAVHEFAHAIDSVTSGEWAENHDLFEGRIAARVLDSKVEHAEMQTEAPAPVLCCHGLGFTRVMAHLAYRLEQRGIHLTRHDTAGAKYGQRDFDECCLALADEPARCRRMSFKQILSLPMPTAFLNCQHETGAVAAT